MSSEYKKPSIDDLVGKTIASVVEERERLILRMEMGGTYVFYHQQDCCEDVWIEEIVGDLQDLVGAPILSAYEESKRTGSGVCDSETWTFYRFTTIKGTVVVRWCGQSNGYYSESVDLLYTSEYVKSEKDEPRR